MENVYLLVGKDRRCLLLVMNVCDVCRSFDSYVRLQVEDSQDHTGT